MNQRIIGVDAAKKLAGLQIDLLQKLRQDQIGLDELEWFVKLRQEHKPLLAALCTVLSKTPDEVNQRWSQNLVAFQQELLKVLRPPEVVKVCDLEAFFHTHSGLWVSNEFRERIVAKASGAGTVRETSLYVLPRNMFDKEIEAELLADHIWSETDACATSAHLISLQPGGKRGTLLGDGRVNLFHTRSGVVNVRWSTDDDREWLVSVWGRGDRRWPAGSQVLSPITE